MDGKKKPARGRSLAPVRIAPKLQQPLAHQHPVGIVQKLRRLGLETLVDRQERHERRPTRNRNPRFEVGQSRANIAAMQMEFLPPARPAKRGAAVRTIVVALVGLFLVLALWAYLHHDPKDRHANDPYSPLHGDVVRDHAARHKLADGSCLELLGVRNELDYRLAACLSRHRLKSWSELKEVRLTPVASHEALSERVDALRGAGVKAFPIQVSDELAQGLIAVVGCAGKERTYLGHLDDLFEILSELRSAQGHTLTREALWPLCKDFHDGA